MRNRRYDSSMRTLRYGAEPRHVREDDEPDVRPVCPECKRREHAKDCPCGNPPRRTEK